MRVHFIAIGGSAMHNLALAMKEKDYVVSGSDDEIFEPSKTRLQNAGILPERTGWYPEKLTPEIDAVILGMHARSDNPELIRAKEMNLKIFSYPEYIYEQTKNKTRIVIGGSHGKTTITSIVLHVLKYNNIACDYLVGAQLEGFNTMVKLSDNSSVAVIEGDEYLSSPIDRRPKFHLYKPTIALLSGIAWDHINVFPTFDTYVDQFRKFISLIENKGTLVYCSNDKVLNALANESYTNTITKRPYQTPKHRINNGITYLTFKNEEIPLQVFGEHNLMNIEGAMEVCKSIGITELQFYDAIKSFKGASKRLEPVKITENNCFYKDFAHSPSKLKATTKAMKEQFPDRKLTACMELHTFSSLNKAFLNEYKDSMQYADKAIVYYNPDTIAHKRLAPISEKQVLEAFGTDNIEVFTNSVLLKKTLLEYNWDKTNLLMMSSGNFDGIDFKELANALFKS